MKIRRTRDRQPRRVLAPAEIELAQHVFGRTIDYNRVRIVDGPYTRVQLKGRVMAPDGLIYWPGACTNVATCGHPRCRDLFIHEMTHVYQFQHGLSVFWRGFCLHGLRALSCGWFDPYGCAIDPGKPFSAYNIEQQAVLAVEMLHGRYPNAFRD